MSTPLDRLRELVADAARTDERIRYVSPKAIDNVPTWPAVIVLPGEPVVEYHVTSGRGGVDRVRLDVVLLAARFAGGSGGSSEILDQFAFGDDRLVDLLERDTSLKDEGVFLVGRRITDYGLVTVGEEQFLGFRLETEVTS